MFGRYELLSRLGKGGMGSVFRARDTVLHRLVALKVPHFDGDESVEDVERFYREARVLANLEHPNICPVYDVGEIDGALFLTMKLLEGKTLADMIEPVGAMEIDKALEMVQTLARALHFAHERGIAHRDLKPANIMVTSKGELVIVDFGLAREMDTDATRLTRRGTQLGTPAYMAPEQVTGEAEELGFACATSTAWA